MDTKLLCDIAQVSTSGYYKWKIHSNERDKDYDDYLLIKEVFVKGKGKYGWRTITKKQQKAEPYYKEAVDYINTNYPMPK